MKYKTLSVRESFEEGRKDAYIGEGAWGVGFSKKVPYLVGYVLEKIPRLDFSSQEVDLSLGFGLTGLLDDFEDEKTPEGMQREIEFRCLMNSLYSDSFDNFMF